MTSSGPETPELLAPLSSLPAVKRGAADYYRELTDSRDVFIRAGAWLQLLSMRAVSLADWPAIAEQCHHASVRALAVDYLEAIFEHDLARQAASTKASVSEDIRQRGLLARLDLSQATVAECEGQMFLATGNLRFLVAAAEAAEAAQGWRVAVPWSVRNLALSPMETAAAGMLLLQLVEAREPRLIEDLLVLLRDSGLHTELEPFGRAALALLQNDTTACIDTLEALTDEFVLARPGLTPLLQWIKTTRATALDLLGRYRDSYEEFKTLNEHLRDQAMKPAQYYAAVKARSSLRIPPLPNDTRQDVVQMLGFPRSGTTLLENALNSHHAVETFEEIPSHQSAITHIYRVLQKEAAVPTSAAEIFVEARHRYYEEIDRRRMKTGASILVDKLPMQSADARFMSRLFPERRYIFSIRHPFDVVLSCFRQQFAPNLTMENFRTIADSVRLYDFTMSEWFGVFTLDSPQVLYVRYEDLVTEFEPTIRRTLGFLGLPWDDAVLEFAAKAEQRAAKTPSYQKVRQGLSIGVQTYWRNYGFVFQTPEAEPLHKWARFFGYPTS